MGLAAGSALSPCAEDEGGGAEEDTAAAPSGLAALHALKQEEHLFAVDAVPKKVHPGSMHSPRVDGTAGEAADEEGGGAEDGEEVMETMLTADGGGEEEEEEGAGANMTRGNSPARGEPEGEARGEESGEAEGEIEGEAKGEEKGEIIMDCGERSAMGCVEVPSRILRFPWQSDISWKSSWHPLVVPRSQQPRHRS